MLKITTLTASHPYASFLENQTETLLYHQPQWWEVLRRSYGYQPAALIALDNDRIVGVLPLMRVHGRVKGRRLVSLPFSHLVPILTTHPDAETALLNAAIEMTHAENYAYLEIRSAIQHEKFQPVVSNHISELDISPPLDTLLSTFSQSRRRNIRQAERAEGFTFREGHTAQDFHNFYHLEAETRHRQGAPMYPYTHFETLCKLMGDKIKIYFLAHNGKDIASTLIFYNQTRAIYAYVNTTSDSQVKQLNPTALLVWETIKACKADGMTLFDFGTTPLHHESLLDFKNRFHSHSRELPYFYYLNTRQTLPIIQRDSKSIHRVENLLKTMPSFLFRQLSPILLREVG